MRSKKLSTGLAVLLAVPAATLFMTGTRTAAQTMAVLHYFHSGKDGASPCGSVFLDPAGNIYGTTVSGGADSAGTVYELSPTARGEWTEKGLYTFGNGSGANPYGNVVFDAAGNLYGTTAAGGSYTYGTVYELMPKAGGGWMEKNLHSFGNPSGTDGRYPSAGLILDAVGNLYGTTELGGPHNNGGIVFELTPKAGGGWTEKALHSFGAANDGVEPVGSLIFDAAGNLYGTTFYAGAYRNGIIFKLSPASGGAWTETVLHSFTGFPDDAALPNGNLIFDADGNLYGISYTGGAENVGTVFELTPVAGGTWTSTVLHSFSDNGVDGRYPQGGVTFDPQLPGNLYGTASEGGAENAGIVFELAPQADGGWTEIPLWTFNGDNGEDSCSKLAFDGAGNLYGTTEEGGTNNAGTVFKLAP